MQYKLSLVETEFRVHLILIIKKNSVKSGRWDRSLTIYSTSCSPSILLLIMFKYVFKNVNWIKNLFDNKYNFFHT